MEQSRQEAGCVQRCLGSNGHEIISPCWVLETLCLEEATLEGQWGVKSGSLGWLSGPRQCLRDQEGRILSIEE